MFKVKAKKKTKKAVSVPKKADLKVDISESKKQAMIKRAFDLMNKLEANKKLYQEMDKLTLELVEMNLMCAHLGNQQFVIKDNFADRNVCFRVARVNRYQLEKA